LFALSDVPMWKSTPSARRSTNCPPSVTSQPAFLTEPRLARWLVAPEPSDGAMIALINASFVSLE
jgi:hypothetical protein